MDPGMVGGIAGGVVGVMGGLIGTYFGVRNTTRPRERRLAVRMAAALWVWIALACCWGLLGPRPWNQLGLLATLPVSFIPRMNRALERARGDDLADKAVELDSDEPSNPLSDGGSTSDFYVEFEVASEEGYRRLVAVASALASAKRDDDFQDDAYWLAFFDDEERSRFWWPTEAERQAWSRRWQAAPVDARLSDPSFRPPSWDFSSMIDAFHNGDYDLLGCQRLSSRVGRLAFQPFGWPYGGTGCMRMLIEAFGHRVTADAGA